MFKLQFSTDNAAFQCGCYEKEIDRIFREIFESVELGARDGIIRDENGNKIGQWSMTTEEAP